MFGWDIYGANYCIRPLLHLVKIIANRNNGGWHWKVILKIPDYIARFDIWQSRQRLNPDKDFEYLKPMLRHPLERSHT